LGNPLLDYLLYLPQGYDKNDKTVPLVLFLHGKGDKLARLERGGLPKQVVSSARIQRLSRQVQAVRRRSSHRPRHASRRTSRRH
jgi:predicted peptidase